MNETNPPPAPQVPPARKNWGWMGYFAFLLIASVGVAGFMIWFNLSIQLKPEEVEAAQTLWKEKGPKSYDLIYRKRLGISGQEDIFAVKVRDRKVESVRMNGEPLERNKEQKPDDDPRIYYSMDAIFHDIIVFMERDQRTKDAKVYVIGNFDAKNGAVQRFIRYDMKTKDRVELNITLTPQE
jgi:hypothetical protein